MTTLGKKVRCRVTGFEGTVVRRTETLYGSTQVEVLGHDGGFRRDEWLEEDGVEIVGEPSLAVVSPLPAPRHPTPQAPGDSKGKA